MEIGKLEDIYKNLKSSSGQSLVEVLAALAIAALVLGALVTVTIQGLRNAQLAQNQLRATKLAQDGVEKIKILRDRDADVYFLASAGCSGSSDDICKFSELWNFRLSSRSDCTSNKCYFQLEPDVTSGSVRQLRQKTESLESYPFTGELSTFRRTIIIEDDPDPAFRNEKKVTVLVKWDDPSGTHESNLQLKLTPK